MARLLKENPFEDALEALPYHTVHCYVFDDGKEWNIEVTFFDTPGDIVTESIEMIHMVTEEAKESAKS